MSPSFHAVSATRRHLISQLVFFDEKYHQFVDTYLSGFIAAERYLLEKALKQYTEKIISVLEQDDCKLEEMLKTVVLIGSTVRVVFEEDGSQESFTIVHPSELDPDKNRISFLSPIGRQLLCAEPYCPLALEIPDGRLSIQIHDIHYAYIGGFHND